MTFVKASHGMGGGFVCFGRMRGWYVCVRVPVLSGGWDKPRCAHQPGEFIATNKE